MDFNNTTILTDWNFTNYSSNQEDILPLWELVLTIALLVSIIIITIVGNILVILSVVTYRPLRTAQNFFIVSLAVADLTVAFLVLPLNVAYMTLRRWVFGSYICQMWLTCDILCCTASILNLVAIALDRYWAITDPINYANKRTLNLVLMMIAVVWVASFLICLPPLFGWNDWPDQFTVDTPCRLTEDRGFVLFSSMGSFFIPLILMLIVYLKIFSAIRYRTRRNRQAKYNKKNPQQKHVRQLAEDSVASENGQTEVAENCKQKLVNQNNKLTVNKVSEEPTSENPSSTPEPASCINDNSSKPISFNAKSLPPELKTTDVVVKIAPGGVSQIHQFIEEKQKISLSKERRAARTLGIIVGVFIVCWLPFFLMYVIRPFCPSCPDIGSRLEHFITWLGYVNSSLNPVIYTIFNVEFRKAFMNLLKCSKHNH